MTAAHLPIPPSPDSAPVSGAPLSRRPSRLNATERADRQALVRFIAASPGRIQWLREHVAAQLDRVADQLAESTLADVDAAEVLHARAGAHRRGETPLW